MAADRWNTCQLSSVVKLIPGYAFKSEDFINGGTPLLKIKNVKAGRVVPDDVAFVDPSFLKTKSSYVVRPGDLLITLSGNRIDGSEDTWVGKVAQFRERTPYLVNQRVGILRVVDEDQIDARFLAYLLCGRAYQHHFISIATSSGGQANLSSAQVLGTVLRFPPVTQQRAISSMLGTLDDKIELNRRRNQTLEAMARAIFKSWFVDFDPVKAKAAVRRDHPDWTNEQVSREACPKLCIEIATRFPDSIDSLEYGGLPEGWYVGKVGDNFRLTMGQSPPGESYNESGNGIPFYQGRTDFGFRFPTRRVYCTEPTRFAEAGDTLVSVRAPVGDVNIAMERCAIGRGVAAVRHVRGHRSLTFYAMHSLSDHFGRFEAEGTVFGSINKAAFEQLPHVESSDSVVDMFERLVVPIDDRVELNEKENATLVAIRNSLLPKLISGELRIPDAERIVGRAV